MIAPSYYDLPEVSCSDLKDLQRQYYVKEDTRFRNIEALHFGSLVDAMLTENRKVNYLLQTLTEDDGNVIHYEFDVFRFAMQMADKLRKDPLVALLLKVMVGQYVFRRTLTLEHDGNIFNIQGRCKYDGFSKSHQSGVDYKMIAAGTYTGFLASIEFFDWDMQAAWYMDLGRIDRHWIIAGSKVNDEIFKLAVQRGDDVYEAGRRKYLIWAYRWSIFFSDFKLKAI